MDLVGNNNSSFDVLLTVHLSMILVINQLNAQILMHIGPCIIVIVEE